MQYLAVFRQLLGKNFKERKPVSSYAKDMNITEKRLAQATLHTVGKTPKQLINERLILEAKRLLIHTQQTAKEVGYSLGFEEPTNFIKYFRKHAHCTPIQFKENNLPG
jgi:AraC-like DNA-binding protein